MFRQRSTRSQSFSTISWVACRKSWERSRILGLLSAAETDAAGQTETELIGVEVEVKEVEVEDVVNPKNWTPSLGGIV